MSEQSGDGGERVDNSIHFHAEGLIANMRISAHRELERRGIQSPECDEIVLPKDCPDRKFLCHLHQFFLGVSDLEDSRPASREEVLEQLEKALHLGFKFADLQQDGVISRQNRANASRPRRRKWAEEIATVLASKHKEFPEAWRTIPFDEGDHPGNCGGETFREEDDEGRERLHHADPITGDEYLTQETFRTHYFSPAKKSCR